MKNKNKTDVIKNINSFLDNNNNCIERCNHFWFFFLYFYIHFFFLNFHDCVILKSLLMSNTNVLDYNVTY